jgi:hypothetical protein
MPAYAMKFLPIAIALLLPTAARAIEYGRELDALIQDHDRAAAAAVEPIHRRFRDQLETLQRRATQANDLETALRIKKMLEEMGDAAGGAAGGGFAKTDIVGNWTFENKAAGPGGPKVAYRFVADGSLFVGAQKVGTWEIKGKQLEIVYTNNPGTVDHYELPARAGKLAGANNSNQPLGLTKRGP